MNEILLGLALWDVVETPQGTGQVYRINGMPRNNADVMVHGLIRNIPIRELTVIRRPHKKETS